MSVYLFVEDKPLNVYCPSLSSLSFIDNEQLRAYVLLYAYSQPIIVGFSTSLMFFCGYRVVYGVRQELLIMIQSVWCLLGHRVIFFPWQRLNLKPGITLFAYNC